MKVKPDGGRARRNRRKTRTNKFLENLKDQISEASEMVDAEIKSIKGSVKTLKTNAIDNAKAEIDTDELEIGGDENDNEKSNESDGISEH